MRARIQIAAVVLVAALGSVPAVAQPAPPLRYELALDLPITGVGIGAWIASEIAKPQLAPSRCRWCEPQLNAVDAATRSALRWTDTEAAHGLSNLTGFVAAPVFAALATAWAARQDGAAGGYPVDVLVIAQATVLAIDFNQIVKLAAGRERPFVRALPPDQKPLTHDPADNNLSFFSGHATFTFALAVSSGTVASMRGYRLAPLVWTGGLAIAALTGYLRIAADRHYLTDVLVGAAVGSAFGFAVPRLFHGPAPQPREGAVSSGGPRGPAIGFVLPF